MKYYGGGMHKYHFLGTEILETIFDFIVFKCKM